MPRANLFDKGNVGASTLLLKGVSALPTIRYQPGAVVLVVNSTGTCMLGINTTGTTWKYISKTSVLA